MDARQAIATDAAGGTTPPTGRGDEVRAIIRDIYASVARLEELYPGRRFTPDGHMVGSLGEAVAAERYGLTLFRASYPVHDGVAPDGRLVQVKATQGAKVGISEEPDYLVVLRMGRDGSFEEVYNGPGKPAWEAAGGVMKTGQRQVYLSTLRTLDRDVPDEERIPATQTCATPCVWEGAAPARFGWHESTLGIGRVERRDAPQTLAGDHEIWRFATLWAQLYGSHATLPFSLFEDDAYVGDGLRALGFEMDAGASYCKAFSETSIPDLGKLRRQLPGMGIRVLGNLIYSQWRYWNHWAMAPMREEDFMWFVVAFTRLAELTGDSSTRHPR